MGVLDVLFGCSHKKLSFPITVRGSARNGVRSTATKTYVVCLDCGHEFPYDWNKMMVVRHPTAAAHPAAVLTTPRRVA